MGSEPDDDKDVREQESQEGRKRIPSRKLSVRSWYSSKHLPGEGVRRGPSEGGCSGPKSEQRWRPRTRCAGDQTWRWVSRWVWTLTWETAAPRCLQSRETDELTTETSAERTIPRAQRVRGWGVTGRRHAEGAACESGLEGGGARRPGALDTGGRGHCFQRGEGSTRVIMKTEGSPAFHTWVSSGDLDKRAILVKCRGVKPEWSGFRREGGGETGAQTTSSRSRRCREMGVDWKGRESCVEMGGVTEMFMQREMVGLGGESWPQRGWWPQPSSAGGTRRPWTASRVFHPNHEGQEGAKGTRAGTEFSFYSFPSPQGERMNLDWELNRELQPKGCQDSESTTAFPFTCPNLQGHSNFQSHL